MGLEIPESLVGHMGLEKAELMPLEMDLEMPKYLVCLDLGLDGLPGGLEMGKKGQNTWLTRSRAWKRSEYLVGLNMSLEKV